MSLVDFNGGVATSQASIHDVAKSKHSIFDQTDMT